MKIMLTAFVLGLMFLGLSCEQSGRHEEASTTEDTGQPPAPQPSRAKFVAVTIPLITNLP
jgi:hypothetical protein